jgi:hypothetical protein
MKADTVFYSGFAGAYPREDANATMIAQKAPS